MEGKREKRRVGVRSGGKEGSKKGEKGGVKSGGKNDSEKRVKWKVEGKERNGKGGITPLFHLLFSSTSHRSRGYGVECFFFVCLFVFVFLFFVLFCF